MQSIRLGEMMMDDMDDLNNNFLFNECRKLYRRNPTGEEEELFKAKFWEVIVEEGLSPIPARYRAFAKVIK
jgi:hypothetical protein